MIKYEVGAPFPFPHPAPGREAMLSELTTTFFNVKAYLTDPTGDEVRDWRKGKLKYGLYTQDHIPFFILAFDEWDLDVSISILNARQDGEIDNWLNAESNIINLYLIDAQTNILKGMRMISVPMDFAEGIRDVLEIQSKEYPNAEAVAQKIGIIHQSYTTAQMRSKGKMYKL